MLVFKHLTEAVDTTRHAISRLLVVLTVTAGFMALAAPVRQGVADERSIGQQIAEMIFNADSINAFKSSPIDEETRQIQRDRMRPFVDTSSVSDRDVDTVTRVTRAITAEAVIAGLRRFLANKIEELSIEQQNQVLTCIRNHSCGKHNLSEATSAFIHAMPKSIGKKAGQLHTQVATLLVQEIMDELKSMDSSEFDNKEETLRVFATPLQ